MIDYIARSGGQDRKIILWNPFSQKPLAQLNGHPTSVQQVLVNDKDNQVRLAVAQIPFPSCLNF